MNRHVGIPYPQNGSLVRAPEEIFDVAKADDAVGAALLGIRDPQGICSVLGETLRPFLKDGQRVIADAVLADPWAARPIILSYTYLAESISRAILSAIMCHAHPVAAPTASERLCFLFVGGSGRAEMAAFSDIDMLFLTPYKQTPWGESVVESVLHVMWDLGLKIGHSVRTVNDCLRLAREDITIRTNLLEARFIMGDGDLAAELDRRLWDELFSTTGPEFVEAKLAERHDRHSRHGPSRYMLEPNVKEGKGGLRDLQTLYWIGKYLTHSARPSELVEHGIFTAEEFAVFEEAENFLWTVRVLLHVLAGRATEQLTFDMQVEIAASLGYEDKDGMRAVEHFMQAYFRHARAVGELTRVFLVGLENTHVKRRPSIGTRLLSAFRMNRPTLDDGFEDRHGRLAIIDEDAFLGNPLNFLRLFVNHANSGLMLHPDAMRLVAANLDLIADDVRSDKQASDLFFDLLLGNANPERALRRMNELGVLGAYLPEFGRVVALMQFNTYHVYTVDEHTINCISILSKIERQELVEDLPVASGILEAGVNRRVLYMALLLHDIGKGLPGKHEDVGAQIAGRICPRLGLPEEETETIVWLVQNHLLMSDVAQKRDISEQRTIEAFAQNVRSVSNLNLLTVLTVCDIMGVGPGRWNNWKAVLIRKLHAFTLEQIREGGSSRSRLERIESSQEALRNTLVGKLDDAAIEVEIARHYPAFWSGIDTASQAILSDLSRRVSAEDYLADIQMDPTRDATRACFAMVDHPGIFARLTGALALAGANVVDARSYTTSDGIATSVFWLQDSSGAPYDKRRLSRLRKSIEKTLSGKVVAKEALREREVERRREREFIVPTTITFDNDSSDTFTTIEVDTRDRPGLLHDLTRVLYHSGLSISSAIIVTYGKQAVDTFYVKDLFGLKVHSEAKQKSIRDALRDAIDQAQEKSGTGK